MLYIDLQCYIGHKNKYINFNSEEISDLHHTFQVKKNYADIMKENLMLVLHLKAILYS